MSTDLVSEMVRRAAKVSDDDLARLDLDDELREVLADVAREPRTEKRPDRRARRLARKPARWSGVARPAIAAMLAAVLVVAVVPPVRAALGDLGETLSGYFESDDPPGRPLESSDSPPAWLGGDGYTGQRVLASAEGYELYLVREPSGGYGFGLDDSVGISDSAAGWEHQFARNAMVILGSGTSVDASGRVPLYGVTAGDVAEVEVRYETEPATMAPAQTGGFVAMIEPARSPTEVVALDRDGEPVQVVGAGRFASAGGSGSSPRRDRSPREEAQSRLGVGGPVPPDDPP